MQIINEIINPLKKEFSSSKLGMERSDWFFYVILAFIIPFTTSISSNIYRTLKVLFGNGINRRRFYIFMGSPKIPWDALWKVLWGLIPTPLTGGRLLIALDDFLNPKTGSEIFGCAYHYNHASKINETRYPWSQNVVAVGLLKVIKGRWASIFMGQRFYFLKKDIEAGIRNCGIKFSSRIMQGAEMITEIGKYFKDVPLLVICDSWFGNNSLYSLLRRELGSRINILTVLRSNIVLYGMPDAKRKGRRGRPPKYGRYLGTSKELAAGMRKKSSVYRVFLYGKTKEVEASSRVLMLKSLRCKVRVVWIYSKSKYFTVLTTDLSLGISEIIEYYGARWKIESGFKELKQDIGSARSQSRKQDSVINHLNFSMMASAIVWIYGAKLEYVPDRRHRIRGRSSFAFFDLRHIISEAALGDNFHLVCSQNDKLPRKSFIRTLLRLVA